jgi:hypothetical protein
MLCLSLELRNLLPRDLKLSAELGQGGGSPVVKVIPAYQDVTMTPGEPLDGFLEKGPLHLAYDLASCIGGALVFDEFS